MTITRLNVNWYTDLGKVLLNWLLCLAPSSKKSSAGLYSGDADECGVWTIKSGGGEDVKIFSVKEDDADADDAGDAGDDADADDADDADDAGDDADADADDGGGDAAEVDAGDDEVDDVDADADDDDDAGGGGGQLIVMSLSSVTAATAQ